MKLSTRARYALRLMLDLAHHGGTERPVSLGSVAQRTGLSRGYLEQLALALRHARLIRGVAGRKGGYHIAKQTTEISIAQILEAAIGPIGVVDCIEDPKGCPRSDFCECRIIYALINNRIAGVLQEYTLADLLDPAWVEEQAATVGLRYETEGRVTGYGCIPNRSYLTPDGA